MPLFLKIISPVIVLVGCIHLALGPAAEVLLGAALPLEAISDPVLDSQNRFYGVAFTVYGFLIFLCAHNLDKYQWVLRILLWVFFAAGCARVVSIFVVGLPSQLVLLLLTSELLLPPIAHFWLGKHLAMNIDEN